MASKRLVGNAGTRPTRSYASSSTMGHGGFVTTAKAKVALKRTLQQRAGSLIAQKVVTYTRLLYHERLERNQGEHS